MKPKINYYLFRIAKENSPYLVTFLTICTVSVISLIIFINKFTTLNQKINSTHSEVSLLRKKTEFINYKQDILNEGIDLEEVNKVLTKLIPTQEDFFSVIYALEEISKKTNFVITGYSLNLSASTNDKLALTITGRGSNDNFFDFLKDYRYIGGRLITIDKIDYKTTGFTQIKLNINFFSGKEVSPQSDAPIKLNSDDKKIVKDILNKVQIEVKPPEHDINYPAKFNPF